MFGKSDDDDSGKDCDDDSDDDSGKFFVSINLQRKNLSDKE